MSPPSVSVNVRKPDKTVVPVEVTVADGIATAEYEVDAGGAHWWSVDGNGGVEGSAERLFRVRNRQVPR